MRRRNWTIIASAFVLVMGAGIFLLQQGPLAQPPAPESPPGPAAPGAGGADPMAMPPGAPGAPGDPMMGDPMAAAGPGMGGAPGGGSSSSGLRWSYVEAPEELTMTYAEYASQAGIPNVLPEALRTDEDGKAISATYNSWTQLQRVYDPHSAATLASSGESAPGSVGSRLVREAERQAAYNMAVGQAIGKVFIDATKYINNNFTFKISHPLSDVNRRVQLNAKGDRIEDTGSLQVSVIMQVGKKFQQTFGQSVYDKLHKYDCLGYGRMVNNALQTSSRPFVVHTYKGGYYRPQVVNLPPEVGSVWNEVWGSYVVRLSLHDRSGKEIYAATAPAGFGGSFLGDILNPPELYNNPKYKLLISPEGKDFYGRPLKLDGTKGWMFNFTVSLTPDQLRRVDSAQAIVLPSGIISQLESKQGSGELAKRGYKNVPDAARHLYKFSNELKKLEEKSRSAVSNLDDLVSELSGSGQRQQRGMGAGGDMMDPMMGGAGAPGGPEMPPNPEMDMGPVAPPPM